MDSYRTAMSEINVTPLVDVMLVLLIIFMVTAPMLRQGIDVTLPKAATSKHVSVSGVEITLTKDHLVYLDDRLVTLKELRRRFAGLGGGKPVLIRADRFAYVDKLIELWDLCRETGFREVHIATLSE
jgi:biopolymer transport protein ExbD